MQQADFLKHGWARFPFDPEIEQWAAKIQDIGISLAADEDLKAAWLRCGGTWFAGVNILPNTKSGAFGASGDLSGRVVNFLSELHPEYQISWDQAQISVCYPGYPMPSNGETEAAFAFRAKRDATHMDGMHGVGAPKRRFWRELHGFILGVPLTKADPGAAPLVVWDKSHVIMRAALKEALFHIDPAAWASVDLTQAYKTARQEVFDTCKRVELPVRLGETTLLHRFTLHGVAPWKEGAKSAPEGRMIAYFRPSFPWSAQDSLSAL